MAGPRIAFIPSGRDPNLASVRLRVVLPVRYLAAAGWDCAIYDPGRRPEYDIVVFQKIYDRERLELASELRARGVRTVLDLCDNHFYNPDDLPVLAERGERLRRMVDLVDVVSVSTATLGGYVEHPEVVVIDDALDDTGMEPPRERSPGSRSVLWRRKRRGGQRDGDAIELVWFGNAGMKSPAFGLVHLPRIVPALDELHAELPIRLKVISNSARQFREAVADAAFPTTYVEWSPSSFRREFLPSTICVVPIEQNPFTICKTNNRLALSLRLGVPVVADSIPSLAELSRYILLDDWPQSLRAYAQDPALRNRHTASGKAYVESTYTPKRVVEQWGNLFRSLAAGDRPTNEAQTERIEHL
jgi:hypothetical protein